jgi:hypothetical protein
LYLVSDDPYQLTLSLHLVINAILYKLDDTDPMIAGLEAASRLLPNLRHFELRYNLCQYYFTGFWEPEEREEMTDAVQRLVDEKFRHVEDVKLVFTEPRL